MSISIGNSISIGSNILNYKTNGNKYIITYVPGAGAYNTYTVDTYLNMIFDRIFPFYDSRKLFHSNVCGANAEYICKTLKIDGLKIGKIIIADWVEQIHKKKEILQSIESVYGSTLLTIGASYHALVYLDITIMEKKYYVAIETTICEPYKLQFYLGNSEAELKRIIKIRYQCNDFKISFDCKKHWIDIVYNGGKRKTRKTTQKTKTKTKTKRRNNKKQKRRKKTKKHYLHS
jgi:hypothetical protein